MPRYHFNVYDGIDPPDNEGVMLADFELARQEAMRLAGALLDEKAEGAGVKSDWRLDVTDTTGLIVFRLEVHLSEPPAILQRAACR